jgi:nitrate reductase gamma subunit
MPIDILISYVSSVASVIGVIIAFVGTIVAIAQVFNLRRTQQETSQRISAAESKAEKEPEKAKPAWDLARVTLEAYFNRNLSQVTAVFWLCVFVMFLGFSIIVWGIAQAVQTPQSNLPAVITGLAGVITEVIGATFLFVYRSTMQQAVNYTKTLERINSVGMAMQILDTIPDDAKADNLKDSTKATVVKVLMEKSFVFDETESALVAHTGKKAKESADSKKTA